MAERRADPSPAMPAKGIQFLLVFVVAAIIAMPFVAGRHPSGGQTLLVLAACVALAVISIALVSGGRQRQDTSVPLPTAEWPPPDELTIYRRGGRRRGASGRDRPTTDDTYVVERLR
jgi:hypothetical protein